MNHRSEFYTVYINVACICNVCRQQQKQPKKKTVLLVQKVFYHINVMVSTCEKMAYVKIIFSQMPANKCVSRKWDKKFIVNGINDNEHTLSIRRKGKKGVWRWKSGQHLNHTTLSERERELTWAWFFVLKLCPSFIMHTTHMFQRPSCLMCVRQQTNTANDPQIITFSTGSTEFKIEVSFIWWKEKPNR